METYMEMLTGRAKAASAEAAKLGTEDKNRGLLSVAEELTAQQEALSARMAALRSQGKERTVQFRELMAQKLNNAAVLSALQARGLL